VIPSCDPHPGIVIIAKGDANDVEGDSYTEASALGAGVTIRQKSEADLRDGLLREIAERPLWPDSVEKLFF